MMRVLALVLAAGVLSSPVAPARADTASRLTLEIGRFVTVALRSAPTHYDALRGADLHWSGAKHYKAKYPLGEFMHFCQVAGNGASASIECATESFTGGEDASEPTVLAAVRKALPPGFTSATPCENLTAGRWVSAAKGLEVNVIPEVNDDDGAVSYAIWVEPMERCPVS